MDAHQNLPIFPNRRAPHSRDGAAVVLDANGAADPQEIPAHLHSSRARGWAAGRSDDGARRDSRVGLKPWRRRADNMKVGYLAFQRASSRFGRCRYDCHAADHGDVELKALATAQPRGVYHLHFGQLVVPVADTVDGFCSEADSAPELTDSELRHGDTRRQIYSVSFDTVTGIDR